MSEMAVNGTSMYDEVEEIRNLNKVKGFDPRKFMRLIAKEGQQGSYYLDVTFRKLWFRLCYPEGKIVKKLIKLTESVAIVEARVYLNRNDAEDNFVANALAQKYFSNEDQFGTKYVELAETAAVGRALSDAGFGLQFADKEGDFDPEVTEAPIDGQIMNGGTMLPEGTYMDEVPFDECSLPGQHNMDEYIPMPGQVGAALEQGMTPVMQQAQAPAMRQQMQALAGQNVNQRTMGNGQAVQAGNSPSVPKAISKDMPVEQIYQMLTMDTAAAVVVPIGFNKGKTLGQVAVEKPENLEWYVSSYGGPDNLLKAAAKFLLDMALGKAG